MSSERPFFSGAVIGAKGSGKSCFVGKLIYELGGLSEREVDKFKQTAVTLYGDESHAFALFCDRTKIERHTQQTIYNNTRWLYTSDCVIALTDTPGNINYQSEKIHAIAMSDFVIIIIPVLSLHKQSTNIMQELHETVLSHWMRKEKVVIPNELYCVITSYATMDQLDDMFFNNLLIAKTFHIKHIIICINKMDTINYDQVQYEEIKCSTQIAIDYFSKLHDININIDIIPLLYPSDTSKTECKWYKNETILDLFDSFSSKIKRENTNCVTDPLRMMIYQYHRIRGVGDVVTGKIFQGELKPGQFINILPHKGNNVRAANVFSIEKFHRNVVKANCGDLVGVNLRCCRREWQLRRGQVIMLRDDILNSEGVMSSFTAAVKIHHVIGQNNEKEHCIKVGYNVHIFVHLARCTVLIKDIMRRNAQRVEKGTSAKLYVGDEAEVLCEIMTPLYVDPYDAFIGMNSNKLILTGKILTVDGIEYKEFCSLLR